MALHRMQITEITWDDTSNTCTITMTAPAPTGPLPDGVDPSNWYPGQGLTVSAAVPIRRATELQPRAIGVKNENGEPVYYRYSWNGTAWVSPVRTDSMGNPL